MIGKWRLHSLSIKPFHVTGLLLHPMLNIRKPWFSMFSSVSSGIKWLRSVFMYIFLTLQKHFGITRLDKTTKSIWIDLKGNAYLITRTTFNILQVKETLGELFSVNFVKFLTTPFFTEHLRRLLLYEVFSKCSNLYKNQLYKISYWSIRLHQHCLHFKTYWSVSN